MNKKLISALAVAGGIVAVTEVLLHGYMDIMAAEKLPKGVLARIFMKDDPESPMAKYTESNRNWVTQQSIQNIDMQNDRKNTVKGYLHKAENDSNVFVVFAHGYRADHLGDPVNFQKFYHNKGYNFLSVDHVAAGDSQGNFVGFDYYESIDLLKWLNYLISNYGEDIKIILHGVSMGGATVCQMASQVPSQVKLIVSDCAYTSGLDQFDSVIKSVGVNKTEPLLKVFNAVNKRFAGYDFALTDVRNSVKNAKVPMLFVHGGADDFVPTKMVYELYDLCSSAKDLLVVDGAAHAESIRVDTAQYESKLSEFLNNYL